MRLGCVPYVNAKPLIWSLRHEADVVLQLEHPSKLPAMLDAGEADAVLASSFDALRNPDRRVVDGVSIASLHRADSVRLFSRVPFDAIETLALDESSLTSNHLAQVILSEAYGVRPDVKTRAPDLEGMLNDCHAAVLIGDRGMRADPRGANVMDLGLAWHELTGLPFVWALWIGGPDLSPAIAQRLREAKAWGTANLETFEAEVALECGWGLDAVHQYLSATMNYDLTEEHWSGLRLFAQKLAQLGFVEAARLPARV